MMILNLGVSWVYVSSQTAERGFLVVDECKSRIDSSLYTTVVLRSEVALIDLIQCIQCME